MSEWLHKVKIKHLISKKTDYKSCKSVILGIYAIISVDENFDLFLAGDNHELWEYFPHEDLNFWDFTTPIDHVNFLLNDFYNYCDEQRIWVE